MGVALAQFQSTPSKEENLEKISKIISRLSGISLVVFPEFTDLLAPSDISRERLYELAEYDDSQFIRGVRRVAMEHGIWVAVGVYERSDEFPRVHSSVYIIGADGELRAKYRKSHLFDALGHKESDWLKPGDEPPLMVDVEGFRLGVIVCYEMRFPELARYVALSGADALIVPSAWYRGYNKEEQWLTLTKARALENTMYVLTSNQIGNTFAGISVAVDPAGVMVARATEEEGAVEARVDQGRISRVRAALPLLEQRRPELYQYK
ncbi:Aliphatic amidase AmiE [Conexivisphaera calida]|uniref:Aliphatic amidase AmiE n=2 Tax=Conexivisphaera calida TaxID=1874277 RepID=A0A4P2VBI7_9ARCH|nr:Aliphatic amidase AmiE [Conexivisphaera calida]